MNGNYQTDIRDALCVSYFAPQISSEDARKWIIHHFNKINQYSPSHSGQKEDILLYLKDQAKCTPEYCGSMENLEDQDKIEETGCTNATKYQCDICNEVFYNANTFRSHKSRLANLGICKSRLEKKRASELMATMNSKYLVEAIEKKQNNNNNEEGLEDLKQMLSELTSKIDYQNSKIDSLFTHRKNRRNSFFPLQKYL